MARGGFNGFLSTLDKRFGYGNYLIFLTADHGAALTLPL